MNELNFVFDIFETMNLYAAGCVCTVKMPGQDDVVANKLTVYLSKTEEYA